MNPISSQIRTGTIGELLVQLRLLQYGVQAAPPIKDSGNDLIAVRRNTFRAIQVKTTTGNNFSKRDLPEFYHLLAVVQLTGEDEDIYLDQSSIFLIAKERVATLSTNINHLAEFRLDQECIDIHFPLSRS